MTNSEGVNPSETQAQAGLSQIISAIRQHPDVIAGSIAHHGNIDPQIVPVDVLPQIHQSGMLLMTPVVATGPHRFTALVLGIDQNLPDEADKLAFTRDIWGIDKVDVHSRPADNRLAFIEEKTAELSSIFINKLVQTNRRFGHSMANGDPADIHVRAQAERLKALNILRAELLRRSVSFSMDPPTASLVVSLLEN